MAVVQNIVLGLQITDEVNFTSADKWDGYSCVIAADFPEGPFQGYQLNWGTYDNQNAVNPFFNQSYSGYSSNWNYVNTDGVIDAFENQTYVGYNTNWGQVSSQPIEASIIDADDNTIVDHPKDQTIYYKLKGYNTATQQYEVWVISQNVTGRSALDGGLFDPDPGREPPNVERDVFKTPPSGNNLVNIVIVARWLE